MRVIAYMQGSYEIEVGRGRVEWPCSAIVTYTFRVLMMWHRMRLTRASSVRTLDPRSE